jgi:hypothetical protein
MEITIIPDVGNKRRGTLPNLGKVLHTPVGALHIRYCTVVLFFFFWSPQLSAYRLAVASPRA